MLPRWLIEATGDPKRLVTFGTHTWDNKLPKTLAFDQFTFPACEACNREFSTLEEAAKRVVNILLARQKLGGHDISVLLDWLDKVRVGLWLGLIQFEGNPLGIKPNFHVARRVAMLDRSVAIGIIKDREPGVNVIGPESPCFGLSPTTFCLLINDVALLNCSAIGLCSRRLGFPFPAEYSPGANGVVEGWLAPGLGRRLYPVERFQQLPTLPILYQPIFSPDHLGSPAFCTEYVRSHSLKPEKGLGGIFLQKANSLRACPADRSIDWIPGHSLSGPNIYKIGRRWAYRKLLFHYKASCRKGDRRVDALSEVHKKLLNLYEREPDLR